jgi:hypothetical protein
MEAQHSLAVQAEEDSMLLPRHAWRRPVHRMDHQFKRHCSNAGNEYLVAVDDQYITDEFNLKGLEKYTSNLKAVTNYILGLESDGMHE